MEEQHNLEDLSLEYQKTRDRLQSLTVQKERFSAQKKEYALSETEITKSTGKIYSAIGSVIIETDKENALDTIKEKEEMMDLRLKIINKQSIELAEKERQQREELELLFKNINQPTK